MILMGAGVGLTTVIERLVEHDRIERLFGRMDRTGDA